MRRLTVILIFLLALGGATHSRHLSSEKTIEALVVRYIPNPCDVHSSPSFRKKRYPHMWYFRIEVKNNLNVPLRVTHYGFYFYENEKWVLRTIAKRILTSTDFTNRFTAGDPVIDGWIQPGKVAVNTRNWVGNQNPVAPRSKWKFTAEDPEGNVYHAEAEIELVPVVEKPTVQAEIDKAGTMQISGNLIGISGMLPTHAQVRLTNFQGNYQQPLQTVVAGKDGQFALRVAKPGIYRLFIFAVGHDRFSIPIILDEESQDFKLDIQPALLNYDEQFTDKKLPFVDFGRQNARLQKVWNIDRTVKKEQEAFSSAAGAHRETNEDMRDFKFDWSETLAMLMRHMQDESDLLVRQSAAIQLGQLAMYGAKIKSATFLEILELLPPSSEIWSAVPHLPSSLTYQYGRAMEKKLLNTFVEENPDRVVRGISLAQLAMKAQFEDDKEMVARYYEKLETEYGDLKEIQHQLIRLNPDKRIMAGKAIPNFEVKLVGSNKTISNKSLLGKFYLLDFWAVWCKPCIQEMKNLHAAYEKFKSKNFSVLSLSFDQSQEDVVKFRQGEWKMPWLHTFVEDGFGSELAKMFEVFSIPKPILVGPDGLILEVGSALRGEALNKTLAKYLLIDEAPK
jgi:thiol-disulfide isomerase/thioredoxin